MDLSFLPALTCSDTVLFAIVVVTALVSGIGFTSWLFYARFQEAQQLGDREPLTADERLRLHLARRALEDVERELWAVQHPIVDSVREQVRDSRRRVELLLHHERAGL